MPNLFDRLYALSPVCIQNIGISAYGAMWRKRRYGGRFREHVKAFKKRENFSPQHWRNYQEVELRRLMTHAVQNVPYYRGAYKDAGLLKKPMERFSLRELEQLPLLEKETIRSRSEEFISKTTNTNKLHTYLTSGTTGTPLAILSSTETDRLVNAAYEARVRYWAGVNYKMSRAMIGGRLVVPQANARTPFWRYNLFERQLYMSAFHISPENVPDYVEALNRYQPDYLVGYASGYYFLARFIHYLSLEVYQPKAVLTSSEKLTTEMRNIIENVFKCSVFDGYSSIENCCLVSECEQHRLHISPDVGIIELVSEAGNPVTPGEYGEIVATGFLNHDQPLIRFRTGDLAVQSTKPCPCGRQMPVIEEIIGRLEDLVIGADGREMVRFHGIFIGLPHVREAQVIQDDFSKFTIRLAIDTGFDQQTCHQIKQRMEDRLGPIEIDYEFVDQIERTERGKFRAVISHVDHNKLIA